jgi:hypothetical protein
MDDMIIYYLCPIIKENGKRLLSIKKDK